MKIAKKLSKSIIALAMCLLLVTTVWAVNEINVAYSAAFDDSALCVNELGKTVTLTVKADQKVDMDAFTAQVNVPEELELADITNTTLGFGEDNFYLENGMILWYSENAENVTNDLLAEISIKVPEGTAAGAYEIVFDLIDISRDWGMPWEDGQTITATLNIVDHADGEDADHLCDACGGAVAGAECVFVPGEYVWAEDYSTCTVTGTCACGETETAEATVTSEVTAGNCQTEEITTYTATFTESWVTNKTVTKEVKGEKDATNHVGEQKTEYVNNGDYHTVTVTCECDTEISSETEGHTYVDGFCVCGAKEPETPDVPVEGLKGDVDLDGDVDMEDFVALAKHIGEVEFITDPVAMKNADVTGDDVVDMNDFTKLAQFIGEVIDEL